MKVAQAIILHLTNQTLIVFSFLSLELLTERKGFISPSIKREKDGTKVDFYYRFHLEMIFLKRNCNINNRNTASFIILLFYYFIVLLF